MSQAADAVRGAALKSFVSWYARAKGPHGLERALARLSADERRRFTPGRDGMGISVTTWYPAGTVHRMLDGLLEGLDADQREALASEGADQSLEAILTGFMSTAFRLIASPQLCAMLAPRLWHSFYQAGRVRITARGGRCHVMEVSHWPGHHSFLCAMNNAAGRAIYRATGCDHVTTEHAACITRGGRSCVYVIRW